MSNIIAPRAFAARIGALRAAPEQVDSLVRYAIYHAYKDGQMTPANQLIEAVFGAFGRGDLFAVVRDTLTAELKGFVIFKGDTFTKVKGAAVMDSSGAEARAMRPASVPDQLRNIKYKRAEKRAEKRADAAPDAAPAAAPAAAAAPEADSAAPEAAAPAAAPVVTVERALAVVLSALAAGSILPEDRQILAAALAAADSAALAAAALAAAAAPAEV